MNERERVAAAMWKAEADRAAPNVGKRRSPENFAKQSDETRMRWLSLADAAIAALRNGEEKLTDVAPHLAAALRNGEGGE